MASTVAHHARCAANIRAQMLHAAGSPVEPDPYLLAQVATAIVDHCGHRKIKAFRLAYGWTVAQAVTEVHTLCHRDGLRPRGLHERSWKQWEAGANTGEDYRDLLSRLFRTGPVQLGFARDYTPSTNEARAFGEIGSSMHRRAFVQTATVLGATVAPDVGTLLRSISPRRSGRVDPERLEDLSIVAAAYRRSYRDMPANQLLQAAHAHLMLAFALDPRFQPEHSRSRLLTVIAEMASLVGVLYLLDREDRTNCWRYVDLAWEAAKAADNTELQAIVMGGRSFGIAYLIGDHRTGLELATYACEIAAGQVSSEARGWVAAVASERAASLGDLSQCQRFIDASRTALTRRGDDQRTYGIGAFNVDKLAAYEGGNMVRLGRYYDAEPILDAAIAHLDPSMQRHRSTALIDRAEARLGANEPDAACDDAAEALELVTNIQHTGNLKRLQAFSRRALGTGSTAAKDLWHNVITATADTKGNLA